MKLLHVALLLVATLLRGPAASEEPTRGADAASLDAVLAATYDVLSGPAGPRDWERFERLFHPSARLMTPRGAGPGAELVVRTPAEYAERAAPLFATRAFHEREVARRTERFGRLAHVLSTYETLEDPAGEPLARGVNSFQLYWDEERWWILSVLWEEERPGRPLPARYLESE